MPNKKISQLTTASQINDSDFYKVLQDGQNKKLLHSVLRAHINSLIDTVINSPEFASFIDDLVSGDFLPLAGGTMAGNIAMANNKITGLGAGAQAGDALRYEQLIGLYLLLSGGTMAGNIAMGGNKVTGLGAGTQAGDALRYEQLIGAYLLLSGGTMAGAIAMGGNKITGLGAAAQAGEALRYEQVIGLYLLLTGGTMSGNIAMGNNKITGLAAATQNGEAVRFEQLPVFGGSFEKLNIGDWNMDVTSSVTINHSRGSGVIGFMVTIISDAGLKYHFGGGYNNTNFNVDAAVTVSSLSFTIYRKDAGFFDSTDFDATSFNRGHILVFYE